MTVALQKAPREGEEPPLSIEQKALVDLGRTLRAESYEFVTVTPETHRGVLDRDPRLARDLRDVFGWSRRFIPSILAPNVWGLARAARVLIETEPGVYASSVRFSTLGRHLLVHSAFPTASPDSVFFGPDTYRFCAFLERHLAAAHCLVDIGCGTGAGGLVAARHAGKVVLCDINGAALRLARVNASLSGVSARVVKSDVFSEVEGPVDLVIANPPYMIDAARRAYRDGGGALGEGLSVRILRESLQRLEPRGRLLLYTGAPIVAGSDMLRAIAVNLCREAGATLRYEELDPDVFGEELTKPGYEHVERIAAVGMVVTVR
ncbi:MAG TPA: class I SAM-dependent methyltransferase [Polyangiaceae bacterium]|jgi:SAM-dependent methyltransferase|nr:class I SAM-dependent methyltransferase [Polyangiaceae bacterium]